MSKFEKPKQLKLQGNIENNFKIFKREVEIFFMATGTIKKSNKIQTARLINIMGAEARKIYYQIESTIKDMSVKGILDAIEKCCLPKKNLVMCQFKFFKRHQINDEPFDTFYSELQELIKNCEFGEAEKNLMRTQIVLGIYNKESQQNLLEKDLDLEDTIKYCQSIELLRKSKQILDSTAVASKVNQTKFKNGKSKFNLLAA